MRLLLTALALLMTWNVTMSQSAPAGSPVAKHGALKTSGSKILDEHNNEVQLFGMSLFWSQWMGQYYTAETVSWLAKDWKCTIVRAAMGIEGGGYLQNPEREKQKIYTVVNAALENGLYVIIDWHDHKAEKHEKEAIEFFSEVSQKFGNHPNIIYEIYNEPLDVSWKEVIKPYSERVIAAIRKHDPDNLIVCGSRRWSQRVDEAAADPIKGTNIAYSLHYYSSTHKQDLMDIAEKAINMGLPLFVTEFGVTEASGHGVIDPELAQRWWDFLDKHKLSWCNWSVADKKENSAALMPGTGTHNWTKESLTRSGNMVRDEIRRRAE